MNQSAPSLSSQTPPLLKIGQRNRTPYWRACGGVTPPKKWTPLWWCRKTKWSAFLRRHAWHQGQFTDGSHLLVFAAWDNYTVERINIMFDLTNTVRGFKNEGWEDYRNKLLGMYPQHGRADSFQSAA